MRVRAFQFHVVITSACEDEQVAGWRAFACLAAYLMHPARSIDNFHFLQRRKNPMPQMDTDETRIRKTNGIAHLAGSRLGFIQSLL